MSSIDTLLKAAEYVERRESGMRDKWQDLPDELVLKIFSYSEVIDLISCGQVSKRTRNISRDSSLWLTANLQDKIVKTELLELILIKGCKILSISNSTIVGCLSSNINSNLKVLNLSQSTWGLPKVIGLAKPIYRLKNIDVLEQLLFSCSSLQQLEIDGFCITSKMAASICKNGKTLQTLNLKHSYLEDHMDGTLANKNLQEIIKCCQELKEVDLAYVNDEDKGITDNDFEYLAKNISPNVEKLNLNSSYIPPEYDDHVRILLRRCNKIKALSLEPLFITDYSLMNIRQRLHLPLKN